MKDFFQSYKFKILICIFALVFGFMIYAAVAGNNVIFPRSVLETVTQPFVSAGKYISDWAENTIDTLVNADKYKKENEELKVLLTEMYGKILDKNRTDEENEKLRSILGIAEENPDYEFSAPCKVIARNANDIYGGFTIDKGSSDGISLYDPVVTSIGLVGVVTELSSHYCTISTIISPEISIGVMTADKNIVGIIENNAVYSNEGRCLMSYIPKDSGIKTGDLVITSGSSSFPADLIIGTVEEVYPDSNGLTLHAVIEPAENISGVTGVFVITEFYGQED